MSLPSSVFAVHTVSEKLLAYCSFRTGSGFVSSDYYLHGFFSASIKLPKDYTAGVVVAFYVSVPSQSIDAATFGFDSISEHSCPKGPFFFTIVAYVSPPPLFRTVGSCLVTWRVNTDSATAGEP